MSLDLTNYRKKSRKLYFICHGVWSEGEGENHQTAQEIAQALNMSRSTNYRTIEKRREWVV